MMKTEDGIEFPREAYAFVGDPEKTETWKLRIWEDPEKKVTIAQLGRAAAALSPGGFRGQKVDIPADAMAVVKARIRAEYKKLDAEPPASIAASETPQLVVLLGEIGDALTRIPLAKIGRWFKGALKFSITKSDLAAVVANFRKRKADVVIDYDHSTEFASGGGQPTPAAGWLKRIDDAPDANGVLWGQAEFTERARKMLREKEYRYISPVINWGARDKITGEQQGATITSIGLTNMPVLEEMPSIALSDAGWQAEETAERSNTMAVKKLVLADRAACTARAVLEDGSETVLSVEGLSPEPQVLRLADIKRTTDGRFDFASIQSREGVLIAGEVFHAQQVQAELDEAVKAGKITPAQRPAMEKLALSDLGEFRKFIASQKPQIDLVERGIGGGSGEGLDLVKLDARISELTGAKVAANKGLTYGQAYKLVLSEHPDLAKERVRLMRDAG